MKKTTFKLNKGFTLIELLVVIAIIGLLASIVLVSVQGPRVSARDAKRMADIRSLQTAMELCYGDSACQAQDAYIVYANYTAAVAGGIGSYISATGMPIDPSSSQSYIWTSAVQTYCVYATLEQGATTYFYASNSGSGGSSAAPPC